LSFQSDLQCQETTSWAMPRISCSWLTNATHNSSLHYIQLQTKESRAAARKSRDAASVLFRWSSPTTFTISIRLGKLRKRPRSELQICWCKTQCNTKSGFKVNQSHLFRVSGKAVRQ